MSSCEIQNCQSKKVFITHLPDGKKYYLCTKHQYGWCQKCTEPAVYRFFTDNNMSYEIIYCCEFHKPKPPKYYGFCSFKGCSNWAEFCLLNDRKPRYCLQHKPNNVDLVHTLSNYCSHKGCRLMASYGTEEDFPIHCYDHKKHHETLL